MTRNKRYFSGLFWRLSAVFVIMLLIFGAFSIYIFSRSTHEYNCELNQRLNADLAAHTVQEIAPYIQEGKVNQEGMGAIMHSMMTINPSVEVYILDNEGSILSYVAPYKEVKLTEVSLAPIHEFIDGDKEGKVIQGDDPRSPGEKNIFSAAPIMEDDEQIGYVYIVLAGQKYSSATDQIFGSYILGISFRAMVVIFLVSMVIGLLSFWFITKRLNRITSSMARFMEGDLDTRLDRKGGEEIALIADTFNELAETVQGNIEELKGVDKLRKELIANVSHDLRTPISSIQGYAETLEMKQGELDAATQKEYLGTIVKNSQRLNQLVEGLFELSKLESGHMKLKPTPFSIAELVHDVASKYRVISQKKGISINTILAKDGPQVIGDISMIDRVLQNLIDNAIKFCSDGDTINIELDLNAPEAVQVRITDSGAGIPKDQIEHIFDRYFKGRSEMNKSGTGLGLSIAKKIVELHGGDISVESQLNVGTTFTFDLPTAA